MDRLWCPESNALEGKSFLEKILIQSIRAYLFKYTVIKYGLAFR
jgi:hypothetical protein